MNNVLKLIACIVLCEAVGIISGIFTVEAIPTWYATLVKPPFSPPNWVFGPVWTTLYALMGISLYLAWQSKGKVKQKQEAYRIFFIQLFLNFVWSLLFFGLRSPVLGFIDIIILLAAILITIKKFYPLSKWAAYLLIPYLLWVTFATILNFSIVLLN